MKAPHGLNFDSAGDMLVAAGGTHEVLTFAPGAAGTVQPVSSLKGAAPGLNVPTGLDLDVSGDLFVADTAANSVVEFPPASGLARPLATIAGPDTGLVQPRVPLRATADAGPSAAGVVPPPAVAQADPAGRSGARSARLRLDGLPRPERCRSAPSRASAARSSPVSRPHRCGRAALTLHLQTSRRAAAVLRRRRRQLITLVITVRGDAGIQHRRLTITCTG